MSESYEEIVEVSCCNVLNSHLGRFALPAIVARPSAWYMVTAIKLRSI